MPDVERHRMEEPVLRLGHVRLTVRDDGAGFEVPKYLGAHVDEGTELAVPVAVWMGFAVLDPQ